MAKRKIGLMGGTFDPVHNAHLALARQAYRQFSLDEVWMLPNGNPPHKRDHSKADVNMRLDMLRLAVKGLSYVKVCDLEQSKDAYHYTFQTLLTLNRMYPEVQFYFIMGADSLFDFEDWREPGIISQECILLAAARDHCRLEEIQQQIEWADPDSDSGKRERKALEKDSEYAGYGDRLSRYSRKDRRRRGYFSDASCRSGSVYPQPSSV